MNNFQARLSMSWNVELVVSHMDHETRTALRDSRTARAKEPEPLTALWSRATTPTPIYMRETKNLLL